METDAPHAADGDEELEEEPVRPPPPSPSLFSPPSLQAFLDDGEGEVLADLDDEAPPDDLDEDPAEAGEAPPEEETEAAELDAGLIHLPAHNEPARLPWPGQEQAGAEAAPRRCMLSPAAWRTCLGCCSPPARATTRRCSLLCAPLSLALLLPTSHLLRFPVRLLQRRAQVALRPACA